MLILMFWSNLLHIKWIIMHVKFHNERFYFWVNCPLHFDLRFYFTVMLWWISYVICCVVFWDLLCTRKEHCTELLFGVFRLKYLMKSRLQRFKVRSLYLVCHRWMEKKRIFSGCGFSLNFFDFWPTEILKKHLDWLHVLPLCALICLWCLLI